MIDFTEQRKHMIDGHLQPSGVRDPLLLGIVRQIPRENYLPEHLRSQAYIDDDICLGEGRFMLRPNDLFRMILALGITRSDRVLDVGCASGYATVIMGFLAQSVVGVDEGNSLLSLGEEQAGIEGLTNVRFVQGAGDGGPYDCILVQKAYDSLPAGLSDQLNEGGRLVYVQQRVETFGQAVLVEKHHGAFSQRALFEMCVPYFTVAPSGFSFQ